MSARIKNLAEISTRFASALIDYGITFTVHIIYILAFGEPSEDGGLSLKGWMALPPILFWFIYFPTVEGVTGKTLGKKILGMRVSRQDGEEISFLNSLLRHIFDWLDLSFLGLAGFFVMKSSDKKQRIGDLIAGTIVVMDKPTFCEKCHVELILSRHEISTGQFVCPKCGHENNFQLVGKFFAPLEP